MRAIELLRVVLGADLTPTEKLTLMAIIHSASWDTWEGQASIKQLAAMSRVSEKSVKRALETLTDTGLISASALSRSMGRSAPRTRSIAKRSMISRLVMVTQPLVMVTQPLVMVTQPLVMVTQPLVILSTKADKMTQPWVILSTKADKMTQPIYCLLLFSYLLPL
jgi:hypothetical protein